jgi:hypothetical protein
LSYTRTKDNILHRLFVFVKHLSEYILVWQVASLIEQRSLASAALLDARPLVLARIAATVAAAALRGMASESDQSLILGVMNTEKALYAMLYFSHLVTAELNGTHNISPRGNGHNRYS